MPVSRSIRGLGHGNSSDPAALDHFSQGPPISLREGPRLIALPSEMRLPGSTSRLKRG
jgi:hypothetical protein